MGDTFSRYHPLVNFIYFLLVFLFTMFLMHPICLLISLVSSLIYSIQLRGIDSLKSNLRFVIPIMLITAIMNPAFNHEGATILSYLPSGNPLTLESIVYGLSAATMLATIIIWFSCYNQVMTSDKFIYLFGRVIPSLSLVLSMALRFVPKFKEQIKRVSDAQKSIGRDSSSGSIFVRARNGMTILSIMISWSLENAIETADSMKSRGYGLEGRTSFSIYRMEKRDRKALKIIILSGSYILLGIILGRLNWRFFPTMKGQDINIYTVSLLLNYLFLCLVPVIINEEEERQWKLTHLKI